VTTSTTRTTGTILDRIVADKREELVLRRREEPLAMLLEKAARFQAPRPFAQALKGDRLRLIAEIKKASPTKGMFDATLDPPARARNYALGGAAAISILTERYHFLGELQHLEAIRLMLDQDLPAERPALLRKDFLFDPYHLHEARAYGADAVLLIVAVLPDGLLAELLALALELGLGALVEVHDEDEVRRAVDAKAEVIGINNRDLRTFHTTLDVTVSLRPLIPDGRVTISESGIQNRLDAERVRAAGVDAVLVGEALMTSGEVTTKMREFMPA
jgi:indole-3-glycerol phosphate synthase